MSLINQALKKAQRERDQKTGRHPDATSDTTAHSYMQNPSGNSANAISSRAVQNILKGIVAVSVLGSAAFFALSFMRTQPHTPKSESAVNEIAPNPSSSVQERALIANAQLPPEPDAALEAEFSPTPSVLLAGNAPVAASPAYASEHSGTMLAGSAQPEIRDPNTLVQTPDEQPVSYESGARDPMPIEAVQVNTPKPEPDATIIDFLEASRVTGVRVSGDRSKVVLNNRVYRLNSIVDMRTNLKIVNILNDEIVLVDESGIQYRKQF